MTNRHDELSPADSSCVSMTGFARVVGASDTHRITCEVKGINSRYLDCVVRIGRELSILEPLIRKSVGKHCRRGRIEFFLSTELLPGVTPAISCAQERFGAYFFASEELLSPKKLWSKSLQEQLAVSLLVRRDFFEEEGEANVFDEDACQRVIDDALKLFRKAQREEGVVLAKDLLERRKAIVSYLSDIEAAHERQRARHTENYREKFADLLASGALPEERLVAEVAVLVERADITEEITRLKSHLEKFGEVMQESPNGRKLDFLLQECVREANTIASKIQDAAVQHLVVEVKAELERVKEQVQNLE